MHVAPIEALTRQAQARPDDTAFIFHEEVWTYRRLLEEAEKVARGLAANGVKAGDRVVLHMVNRPEMLVAFHACCRIGAIAAPLRTAFIFAELGPMLQRLAPALYIGESALYPNIAPVDAAILGRNNRILIDAADKHGARPWEVLKQADRSVDMPEPDVSKPALLINTSGTTGQSKFVMHTLQTIGANIEMLGRNLGVSPGDVCIVSSGMAHVGALFLSLTFIRLGLPFVVLETFEAGALLDAVERHNGSLMFGFPAQFAALVDGQKAKPRNISSLRRCIIGGDACPADVQEHLASALGTTLYNMWGATEAVGTVAVMSRPGPVVRVVDETLIRLVDENGVDVARGETGEILVRGPHVSIGYWNDPAATAQGFEAGWWRSGDLMRRGDGDELWIIGRKKDIIVRGGVKISPVEIEEMLLACHPAVEEAAVVGKPDPVLGQRVFGFVKLAPGESKGVVAEILENVARSLAPYKLPEDLEVVDALPRNALSKVDRRALEAMARDHKAGKSAA